MQIVAAGVLAVGIGGVALAAATQTIAAIFAYQSVLGDAVLRVGATPVYWPWQVLVWDNAWASAHPRPFALARIIYVAGAACGLVVAAFAMQTKLSITPFGRKAWGGFRDAAEAGLFATQGTVLGKLGGEILCFDGPEHQILVGASRSGKGRGHVVPTLLTWPASAVVLDIKGELADGDARLRFAGTAGFRQALGPVIRFAPTRADSVAFNPLLEVRRGVNEVRDVQNIVEILVDPAGAGRTQDFWDRSAKQVLVGVILHVLYAEPCSRKTLAVVREKLRDLDTAAKAMQLTFHRRSPLTGAPEVHPEVLHAAESYLAAEARLKSGVKATAESFLGLFADEIIATKTATSDFRIGDLMCASAPVTLYLQPPPSDATRLMPLLRLFINQLARALMEDQLADAQGRQKRHRLLLVLDEFPMLGKMPFFETMMGAMAGYGLKAYLVCQSLNHVVRAYGRDNTILDNCHVVTAFAAADTDTARRIAEMAGEVYEVRESETRKRPRPLLGWTSGSTSLREERRPLLLPGDVRQLKRDEQLIFVAGTRPIRARKLKFDRERRFTRRLRPATRDPVRLTTNHDWLEVRALGVRPEPKLEVSPAALYRSRHGAGRSTDSVDGMQTDLWPSKQGVSPAPAAAAASPPALALKAPLSAQRDLFHEAALRPQTASGEGDAASRNQQRGVSSTRKPSISERASAGFRDESGTPLPHPHAEPSPPSSSSTSAASPPPPPRARAHRRPEGI